MPILNPPSVVQVARSIKPIDTAIGAAAGLIAAGLVLLLGQSLPAESIVLLPVGSRVVQIALHLLVATLLGSLLANVVPLRPRSHAAVVSGGALAGLQWWLIGLLTLAPLLNGDLPTWSIETAADRFSNLVSALVFGAVTGVLSAIAFAVIGRSVPSVVESDERSKETKRVVILGGGFGGIAAAQRFEEQQRRQLGIDVTLVSSSNSLLFTPMLAEVVGSSLEPQHISSPVRASIPRTRFVRASVSDIDTGNKVVHLSGAATTTLEYDQLILALGSVPAFHQLPGIEEHSLTLKSLDDAMRLRNHAIGMLELADTCPDPEERRRLLTFVIAGGGFAGTETAAELFDLAHNTLRYYPNVQAEELRFVLVHSRDRILQEIGPELADYALKKLEDRGIEFRLNVRIASASADRVVLADGSSIPTRTLVWTAGNQPNPVLASLPCDRARNGSVVTEPTMAVPGVEGVWAVGDGASIPDPFSDGATYPPTAQHALREGKKVADNIVATVQGKAPAEFRFKAIGILVALGHRTAVAEIRGLRFSGLVAWMMWRAIYLSKLPGLEQKTRVLLDWTLDLFFPRDITLTGAPPTVTTQPESAEHDDSSVAANTNAEVETTHG